MVAVGKSGMPTQGGAALLAVPPAQASCFKGSAWHSTRAACPLLLLHRQTLLHHPSHVQRAASVSSDAGAGSSTHVDISACFHAHNCSSPQQHAMRDVARDGDSGCAHLLAFRLRLVPAKLLVRAAMAAAGLLRLWLTGNKGARVYVRCVSASSSHANLRSASSDFGLLLPTCCFLVLASSTAACCAAISLQSRCDRRCSSGSSYDSHI